MSPQARAFFRSSCEQVKIPPLNLLTWIRTRWASLFFFLERIIRLRLVSLMLLTAPVLHTHYSSYRRLSINLFA